MMEITNGEPCMPDLWVRKTTKVASATYFIFHLTQNKCPVQFIHLHAFICYLKKPAIIIIPNLKRGTPEIEQRQVKFHKFL